MQPKLFFVLGAPKSGTTWLQHILNAHPNVSCRGEGMFHKYADLLVQIRETHNQQLAQREKLHGVGFPPMSRHEVSAMVRVFIEMRMRAHPSPKPDLQWIGEKDPDHAHWSRGLMPLFRTSSYIHIIRDPRDRAVSLHFHMRHRLHEGTGYPFQEHVLHDAQTWAKTISSVRANAREFGVRYHELRYEDLLDRPNETTTAVFNFLGVDTTPVQACIEAASFEKLSGGRKPGQEDLASFYRKGVQGDWRNHMDAEQERAFIAATGGLMADLGYA